MSDLTAKFDELQAQLTSQHDAMMGVLTGISIKLDLLSQIRNNTQNTVNALATSNTHLNNILTALTPNLGYPGNVFQAILSTIEDTNAHLLNILYFSNNIFSTLDVMNNNASLNTQYTLAAIYGTACSCDLGTPSFPPPLDGTYVEPDVVKCKRAQFFVDLYAHHVNSLRSYITSGAQMSTRALADLLNATLLGKSITTGNLAAGMPMSVASTINDLLINQIIIDGRNGVSDNLFLINDISIFNNMTYALFIATNAEAAQNGIFGVFDNMEVGQKYIDIHKAMFYTAWCNDALNQYDPLIDDSAYDGTLCESLGGT